MKAFKQINIPIALYNQLKERRHANQSMGGVITEALGQPQVCTNDHALLERLERYRTHPRESQEELVSNALDQLEELEKQLVK